MCWKLRCFKFLLFLYLVLCRLFARIRNWISIRGNFRSRCYFLKWNDLFLGIVFAFWSLGWNFNWWLECEISWLVVDEWDFLCLMHRQLFYLLLILLQNSLVWYISGQISRFCCFLLEVNILYFFILIKDNRGARIFINLLTFSYFLKILFNFRFVEFYKILVQFRLEMKHYSANLLIMFQQLFWILKLYFGFFKTFFNFWSTRILTFIQIIKPFLEFILIIFVCPNWGYCLLRFKCFQIHFLY